MEPYIKSIHVISKYKTSLVIFTRDLRIHDNYVIEIAGNSSENLIGCFIFTNKQIDKTKNKYYSDFSFNFMLESLEDLSRTINLHYFENEIPISILKKIDAIFIASDYTKYAKLRQSKLETLCKANNINFIMIDNHLLEYPMATRTPIGAYQKYTPYYNAADKNYKPIIVKSQRFKSKFIIIDKDAMKMKHKCENPYTNPKFPQEIFGGREAFFKMLKGTDFSSYEKTRNDPTQSTTRMSAYIKFGCVSVREVYEMFKQVEGVIKQLWWREFYYNIAIGFPHTTEGESLKTQYDAITWENKKSYIDAWKKGETGYDFVDAGMLQLKYTGFMHNRLRLVTANFLIKDLHVDWRIGERHFANYLIDYDPIVNNGNWQWCSGSGADSQPYFRIFNPETQMKTHDPQEIYVKYYLYSRFENDSRKNVKKIIDHDKEKKKTIEYYAKALK